MRSSENAIQGKYGGERGIFESVPDGEYQSGFFVGDL